MRRRRAAHWAITAIGLAACASPAATTSSALDQEVRMRFVALGDSYTIGTSVSEDERWPNQLVERIPELELVGNPAINGYTSANLIEEELPALEGLAPELVTVLIGVNDVVQGVDDAQYAGNVAIILDELLGRLPPGRIICIATPDYTVTPQGAAYGDPDRQSARIAEFNAILREACEVRGIRFVPETFAISREAQDDPTLVAEDGLHPSGAQYRRWVDAIAPVVEELLGD